MHNPRMTVARLDTLKKHPGQPRIHDIKSQYVGANKKLAFSWNSPFIGQKFYQSSIGLERCADLLRSELNDALKSAMKTKDTCAVGTIRLILASIKDQDICARTDGDSTAYRMTKCWHY